MSKDKDDEIRKKILEEIRKTEDDVKKVVDGWDDLKRSIAYRYLYTLGLRVSTVDTDIQREAKKKTAG